MCTYLPGVVGGRVVGEGGPFLFGGGQAAEDGRTAGQDDDEWHVRVQRARQPRTHVIKEGRMVRPRVALPARNLHAEQGCNTMHLIDTHELHGERDIHGLPKNFGDPAII